MENTESIDMSGYLSDAGRVPGDDHLAMWTFAIGGTPATFYGSFRDACALAKIHARLWDVRLGKVVLERREATGRPRRTNA
ncbi:MAG: hypothetical protein IIB38_00355 [Candidatus Hydrogenedentes bacterium]|nr:hypothetical protein [Candidatus Hydrogenedentota bacterium]